MTHSLRLALLAVLAVLLGACAPKISLYPDYSAPLLEQHISGQGENKIALVYVTGPITTNPRKSFGLNSVTRPSVVQETVAQLHKAGSDPSVRALVLIVDSPGGTVVASDLLYTELMKFRRITNKPIVVQMLNVAASGGYYLSLAANSIHATPSTITGSVGTIFVSPQVYGLMDKLGLGATVIKSGRYKDIGSPLRPSQKEELKALQNMIDSMNSRFLKLVKTQRKLDQKALNAVAEARVLLAGEALELGLVDAIGYTDSAIAEAKKLAGITGNARVIAYRRTQYPDDNVYNTATGQWAQDSFLQNTGVQINLFPNLPTGFYHLWAPELSPSASQF
ncbi:signal peptide peptidase SppA [Desulfobaculum bizertense]|uniref:signal peptide peptidase SppA n=1 Tax=Desulfobaculum bizertense TaxID=376490 RepID=UPI001F3A8EAD|nr:signal peptide peptidase SppA [Desulfobaculum bizertense]UIJ38459.1 signal peptide peptidase SppA [Desulfobaculum bizertense]